jgi:hypothetical protein
MSYTVILVRKIFVFLSTAPTAFHDVERIERVDGASLRVRGTSSYVGAQHITTKRETRRGKYKWNDLDKKKRKSDKERKGEEEKKSCEAFVSSWGEENVEKGEAEQQQLF